MDWESIEKEIGQGALESAQAAQQRIADRRAARRKRQRRRRLVQLATAGSAVAIAIGVVFMSAASERSRTPTAPLPSQEASTSDQTQYAYIEPTATPEPTPEATDATKLLVSVPLDAETQTAIFELCGSDPDTFCAVMAISKTESNFDTDAVGDNGVSIGMAQINTTWQTGRMESLGVTDLTAPVQCATVCLDYLRELSEDYGFGWVEDHGLYLAYNMGPGGARNAINSGVSSSKYSRAVLSAYGEYAAEMEVSE